MLTYNSLSSAQRRWVDLVEIYFPEIKTRGVVTNKEVRTIHDFFVGKRAEDKRFKISHPIWLITNNAVSRGVYTFPSSSFVEESAQLHDGLELIYRTELAAYNIKPKP